MCAQQPMQEKATGLGDSLFTLIQPAPKTYTDYKTLRNESASYLYEGKCKETTTTTVNYVCGQPANQEMMNGTMITLYKPAPKTYESKDAMYKDNATYLYGGKCKATTETDDATWENFMNDMNSSGTK